MTYSLRSNWSLGVSAGEGRPAADEHLREPRLDGDRARPDEAVVGRHVAPAEQRLTFFGDDAFEQLRDGCARTGVVRQEHQADAVLADRRERSRRNLAQERVRHLHQDAGAVAGVLLASARAAVRKVDEDLKGLPHDAVRLSSLHVDDEADAAGVVLVSWVV